MHEPICFYVYVCIYAYDSAGNLSDSCNVECSIESKIKNLNICRSLFGLECQNQVFLDLEDDPANRRPAVSGVFSLQDSFCI